jgi:hypothetical protein
MVDQRGHQNAQHDGPGLAKARRQYQGEQLVLSPISARATMAVETRKASMVGLSCVNHGRMIASAH